MMAPPGARRASLALLLALAGLGAGALWLRGLLRDPAVRLLLPEHGARWILRHWEEGPKFRGAEYFTAAFRTRFHVATTPERAVLHVRPFRQVLVFLDGKPIGRTPADLRLWKETFSFDLAPLLGPGEHELFLSAVNRAGPPAALAWCEELGIRTGEGWEARNPRNPDWVPAADAEGPQANTVGEHLPRADRALLGLLPLFLPVFGFVAAAALAASRAGPWGARLRRAAPSAGGVRWLVLGAWALLAANNVHALPYSVGYDVDAHLQYVEFIVRKRGIPFADQGWQMFQAPLYHLVSAPLYLVFRQLLSPVEAALALRVVPLLCGALQVEICHRLVRRLHPRREDLQALGTVLGGLLPINVYLSQNLSNEPLMALFASALILLALDLLHDHAARFRARTFLLIGTLLGAAVLTKVTAVLLLPVLACLVARAAWLRFAAPRETLRRAAWALGLVLAPALLVAGWYYARNWWVLGAPVVGGWDPERGYVWWQEPGYRTLGQFLGFGSALAYPVYSAVHGFWDGFYSTLWLDGYAGSAVEFDVSPLWNFDFLLASAWLSLLPVAALAVGAAAILATPARSARSGDLFALLWLASFVLAMALLALRIPSFSTVKASYTLAALTAYAAVGARGFEVLVRGPLSRALVFGAMACWALCVVAGYYVV
jgi:hypothetical protein